MNLALVAVQLEIGAEVLVSGDAYRAHIEAAVGSAIGSAPQADMRLVVVPEIAGHLALYATGSAAAHKAKTLGTALAQAAVRRPLDVLRGVASARTLDPKHAVLAALAPDGEKYWRSIFGPLARKHAAWIVAGSHLRLAPSGDLTNASMTFAPDGRCVAVTDKVNLVPGLEDGAPGGLHLSRGDVERVPVVDTPAGKLATVICYDGFHEPHTLHERFVPVGEYLKTRGGVAIAANPAANPWAWRGPWPPANLTDPASSHATREIQWQREGLPGTLGVAGFARWGVTAHLVGAVLDLRFEGQSEILDGTAVLARVDTHDRGGHVAALVRANGG